MACIVSCHFFQYFDNDLAWWLNTGVQVFLIISGFLYGNKVVDNPLKWLYRQFVKILIPYWCFLIPAIVLYSIFYPSYLSVKNLMGVLLTVNTIKGISHLWFISNILLCYIMTPYLQYVKDALGSFGIKTRLVIILSILGIISLVGGYTDSFVKPSIICCYVTGYFLAGLYYDYGFKSLHQTLFISIIPCLLANGLYIYLRYTKGLDMVGLLEHVTGYSKYLLALVVFIVMMLMFKNVKFNRWLSYSDRYSYPIYLVHQFFIVSPFTVLCLTSIKFVNIEIALLLIIASAILLAKGSDKIIAKL